MKKLFMFAVLVLITPLTGLLFAWMLSTVWNWFMLKQYGAGPSYQAWFGVTILWQMLSWNVKKERITEKEDVGVAEIIIYTVVHYIALLIMLGVAAIARAMLGWS